MSERPPLGALALVSGTVRLFFAHLTFLFPIAFVPSLVVAALSALVVGSDPGPAGVPALSGAFLLTSLIDVVVGFIVAGIMCLAAIDAVVGKRHAIGDYLAQTMRHLWPILLLGTLLYVMAGIGFALLIVPGLYIAARYLPWIAAIVFENAGWSGLTRAQALTEDYRWPLVGAILLFGVLGIAAMVLLAPVVALGHAAGAAFGVLMDAFVAAVLYGIVAIFTALVYARLREIKEKMTASDIGAAID